jgi:hypothetical protein
MESACRAWERDVALWQASRDEGEDVPCPEKPAGYDLFVQGEDPMGFLSTKGPRCHGGGLVPDTWTSDALPVRLPEQRLEQQPLL